LGLPEHQPRKCKNIHRSRLLLASVYFFWVSKCDKMKGYT